MQFWSVVCPTNIHVINYLINTLLLFVTNYWFSILPVLYIWWIIKIKLICVVKHHKIYYFFAYCSQSIFVEWLIIALFVLYNIFDVMRLKLQGYCNKNLITNNNHKNIKIKYIIECAKYIYNFINHIIIWLM